MRSYIAAVKQVFL